MSSTKPLAGKHALVTGASRGIGAAIVRRLLDEGARVTLLGRQLTTVRELAEKLSDQDTYAVAADVSDTNQMRAAIEDASHCLGPSISW